MNSRLAPHVRSVAGALVLVVAAASWPAAVAARPISDSPSLSAVFDPASIPTGGTTTLRFFVKNPTATVIHNVAFDVTLPSTLRVMDRTSPMCEGTLVVTKPVTISLGGAKVAPASECVIDVTVYGWDPGTATLTTSALRYTEGTGPSTSASVSVWSPPVPTLTLTASTIRVAASTTLTIHMVSPHPFDSSITGLNATIAIPAGLEVAPVPSDVCGGVLSIVAGGLQLAGARLPPGTYCHVDVHLTGRTAGTFTIRAVLSVGSYTYEGNTATVRLTVSSPAPVPAPPTPTPVPTDSDVVPPGAGVTSPPPDVAVVPPEDPTGSPLEPAPAVETPTPAAATPAAATPAGWPTGGSGDSGTAVIVFGLLALVVAGAIVYAYRRRRANGPPVQAGPTAQIS